MREVNCENVILSAMAIADNSEPVIPRDEVEAHMAACAACRQEVEQLKAIAHLLDSQKRREPSENLWPQIAERLGEKSSARAAQVGWQPFLLLGSLLLAYKIIVMVPHRDFGLALTLSPVLLMILLFSYLKENPFKIDPELRLEME